MSILFWIITINNFYFTIYTSLKPGTVGYYIVMAIYWCMTVASILIMAAAHFKKDMKYARPAYFILTIRNIMRIYNFEGQPDTEYQKVIQNLICLYMS